mmetsp:Transcript_38389/g.63217  ORF Transcript_38389/g.63217 Transcript_38389/m.63217 type:complete len:172 (+) Transcript_38389:195-710(+)
MDRKAFGQAVVGGAAAVVGPAIASAGEGAKFSVFGGAASEPYTLGESLYSPYSPFGPGDDRVYSKFNDKEVKFNIGIVTESQKRLTLIPAYLEKKKWIDTVDELTRYMYNTRKSMNYLAEKSGNKNAAKIKKDFFTDIEAITVACKRKQQDVAVAAHAKATKDLDAFLKAL